LAEAKDAGDALDGDTGVVPYFLVATREGIEEGGFAGVRVSDNGDE
jgi:hypothetical protein